MATTATLGGLSLTTGAYSFSEGIDWGGNDLATTLLTGDLRVDEYDQYLAELRYTRQVVFPFNIRSGTFAQSITDTQAVIQKLSAASRYSTIDFVFTPNGGNASTFKVIGGAVQVLGMNQQVNLGVIRQATLTLDCLPFVYGATQTFGSSGSPLVTNTASPANVTLTLSPTGDVPADVTLFVKNRSASAIRSLLVSCVSGNTTWTAKVDQSTWTLDADGTRSGGLVKVLSSTPTVLQSVAHFTAPTLPTDRRFRVYLRVGQLSTTFNFKFRVRLVSGSSEIVGAWRALPVQYNSASSPYSPALADMGAFTFPVSEVGQLGGQSTTVYVEALEGDTGLSFGDHLEFSDALFYPDDNTLLAETTDTSKTLAAASGITRVEVDQVYDNSGNPAGGVVIGSHIRSLGGRYAVYTSQGYAGSLDLTLPYAPENVDLWASAVPRYIHLA